MRTFGTLMIAAAMASLASFTVPSMAGSPYYLPTPAELAPPPAVFPPERPNPTNPGMYYAQPDGAGQFDCQRGEKRTHMQRRACGPMRPDY